MVMAMTDNQLEALTETIIGCAIEVHKTLGPGLLESVYRECLILELRGSRLGVEIERRLPFDYKGQRIRSKLIVDLLVEKCIVVELKASRVCTRWDQRSRHLKKFLLTFWPPVVVSRDLLRPTWSCV